MRFPSAVVLLCTTRALKRAAILALPPFLGQRPPDPKANRDQLSLDTARITGRRSGPARRSKFDRSLAPVRFY